MLTKDQMNLLKKAVIELVEAEIDAAFAGSQPPAEMAFLRLKVKLARQNYNFLLKSLTDPEASNG